MSIAAEYIPFREVVPPTDYPASHTKVPGYIFVILIKLMPVPFVTQFQLYKNKVFFVGSFGMNCQHLPLFFSFLFGNEQVQGTLRTTYISIWWLDNSRQLFSLLITWNFAFDVFQFSSCLCSVCLFQFVTYLLMRRNWQKWLPPMLPSEAAGSHERQKELAACFLLYSSRLGTSTCCLGCPSEQWNSKALFFEVLGFWVARDIAKNEDLTTPTVAEHVAPSLE